MHQTCWAHISMKAAPAYCNNRSLSNTILSICSNTSCGVGRGDSGREEESGTHVQRDMFGVNHEKSGREKREENRGKGR